MADRILRGTATTHFVPEGIAGAKAKVGIIWRFIRKGWADPAVIRQAENIVRWLPERNPEAEARAIYNWAKKNTRYTREKVEKIKEPGYQLRELGATGKIVGDCDCSTVLIGSLAGAISLPIRTVILGNKKNWYHIYPETYINGWRSLDIVGERARFGRKVPGQKIIAEERKMIKTKMASGLGEEIMIAPDIKVDPSGNVYVLEETEVAGVGEIGRRKKWWRRVGKVLKKVAKVAIPVAGAFAVTKWGVGAIKRAAERARRLKEKAAAAKAKGQTLIIDKVGREIITPAKTATATMIQAAKEQVAAVAKPPVAPPVVKKPSVLPYVAGGLIALKLLA